MPRRIFEPWVYHIYNRWFEKMMIFKNTSDFQRFYTILKKYLNLEKYKSIKILSYCFLPNHFHFIVSTPTPGLLGTPGLELDISSFFWDIQNSYAKYFNLKYPRKWQLFEGRFKAKLIQDEQYLFQCMLYVNYNAQKHQIVKDIADYPYTSYHQIIGRQARDIISADDINQDFMKLDFTQIDLAELEF
jgi:putative transposase